MDNDEAPSDTFKEQGNAAFQMGEYSEAVDCYTNGIAQNPSNAVLFSNRSAAYLKQNIYDKAKLDADMCIELDPKWSKGWWRKGTAQIENQEYKGAQETFREGLKHCPGDSNLTIGLERAGRYVSALESVVGPGETEFDLNSQSQRRKSSDDDNGTHAVALGKLPNGSMATHEMNTENHVGASEESAGAGLNGKTTEAEGEANLGKADKSMKDEPDGTTKSANPWPGTPEQEIERIKKAPNHYAVLHISTDASSPQMKKNYYALARMLHPDRCQLEGAGDAMTSVSQAYDTLSNVLKKTLYDQFLSQTGGDEDHPNQTYQEWESRQQPVEIPKWLRFLLDIKGCGYILVMLLLVIFLPLFIIIVILYIIIAILTLPVSLIIRIFFPEKYARMKERQEKEIAKMEEEAQDQMFAHV